MPEEARVSDLRVTVEVARVVGLSLREQEAQTMVRRRTWECGSVKQYRDTHNVQYRSRRFECDSNVDATVLGQSRRMKSVVVCMRMRQIWRLSFHRSGSKTFTQRATAAPTYLLPGLHSYHSMRIFP